MSDLKSNLAKAQTYIARFAENGVLNHINGQAVHADDREPFSTVSPVDMTHLADVAHGKASDIDKAAQAAQAAFKGWSETDPKERSHPAPHRRWY